MKTATSSAGAAPTVETGVKPRRGRKRQVAGGRRAARKPPSAAGLGKQGDPVANRRAAAILEVLAGEKLPSQAAGALGISVTHYYILERKALEGLLAACQPRPQGRAGPSDEEKLARLERELERSRRECRRQAALVRATQRAVGLPASTAPPSKSTSGGVGRSPSGGTSAQRTRRRRPRARALRAAAVLEKNSSLSEKSGELQPSLSAVDVAVDVTGCREDRARQEGGDGTGREETTGNPACRSPGRLRACSAADETAAGMHDG